MKRLILFMLGFAAPASAQTGGMALFKSDAQPYIHLSQLADEANSCGLRSSDWNLDAQTAINDKFSYFAGNIWEDPNAADAQAAIDWATEEATLSQEKNSDYTPRQCAALANSDNLTILDDLIITDTNLPGAASDVPRDIPANAAPSGQ